ncbi:MAG: 4'-phosphopantetheinyl transferase superfamily protein [Myxococcales bacterium]|nr:MAG: 4'-phosphopantetheinyl transferase superfamily protein [Myxococcales bacterium]
MTETAPIPSTALELWYSATPTHRSKSEQHFCAILSDDERERWKHISHRATQWQFLCARFMLRSVLSKHHDCKPDQWRFAFGKHGKPFIASPDNAKHLQFNIAHTDGAIALALGQHHYLGVDIENQSRSANILTLARRHFSSHEFDLLQNKTEAEQQKLFFELWTLKEAYMKARGLGFALSLKHICFELPLSDSIRLLANEHLQDNENAQWLFSSYHIMEHYSLALAAKIDGHGPENVTLSKSEFGII